MTSLTIGGRMNDRLGASRSARALRDAPAPLRRNWFVLGVVIAMGWRSVVASLKTGLAHQPDALAVDFGAAGGDEALHDSVADPARAEAPAAAGVPFERAEFEQAQKLVVVVSHGSAIASATEAMTASSSDALNCLEWLILPQRRAKARASSSASSCETYRDQR
jgi:hypothetical protein